MDETCDREFSTTRTPAVPGSLDNPLRNRGVAFSPSQRQALGAAISCYSIDKDLTLKEAALATGVSEELFDRVVTRSP